MANTLRICIDCSNREGRDTYKPVSEFARNGTRKDKLQTYCKECGKLRAMEYGRRKGLTWPQYIKYLNEKKHGVTLRQFKEHYNIDTPDYCA